MSKQWIFSDLDLLTLILALQTDIQETERSDDFSSSEKVELISKRHELAHRLQDVRNAFRKDTFYDEETGPNTWLERDQAVLRMTPKPGDEPYTVVPWGPDRWVIVERANPGRPVNEHIYTQKTHAYRKKRELNKAARQMNEILAANGGALIL